MSSQRFYDLLKQIGYPGLNNLTPNDFDWTVDENPEFFEWICNGNIGDGNILTPSEVEGYENLVNNGVISEIEVSNYLESSQILDIQMTSAISKDSLTDDIREVKRKLIKQEINALNCLKNSRSQCFEESAGKISEAKSVAKHCQKNLQRALKESECVNQQTGNVVDELYKKIDVLEEGLKGCEADDSPNRFAHLLINEIVSKEELYNSILKEFLKVQFPKNIRPETLDDSSAVYTAPQQKKLLQEAELLNINLVKSYNEWLTESLLEVSEAAKNETLAKIQRSLETGTLATGSNLRGRSHILRKELADINEKLIPMKEKAKSLINKFAEDTTRAMFIDGCDLKRARQAYFTYKIDMVIERLVLQRAHCVLISWFTTHEHDLLTNIQETLEDFCKKLEEQLENKRKRMEAMEKLKDVYLDANLPEDKMQMYLKKLAVMENSNQAQPKKIIGRFGFDMNKFVRETKNKETELIENIMSNFKDQHKHIQERAQNLNKLQTTIWSDSPSLNVVPNISPKVIIEGIRKMENRLNSQQKSLDQAVEDYRKKLTYEVNSLQSKSICLI